MNDVNIVGAAMTPFGKFEAATIRTLAESAVAAALGDAGLLPGDVEMVFFSNAAAGVLTGQEMIRGQVALRYSGLLGKPMVNVENACASGSSALFLACAAIRSGTADVALVVGSEKLSHPDKTRPLAAIGGAVDQMERAAAAAARDDSEETSAPRSSFMDIYAARARAYMERSGATQADFATVAVKSHRFGALNERAQYRQAITTDQVLASRTITWPLTLMMCSPVGDGAAALVVCSDDYAGRLTVEPIRVLACELLSGQDANLIGGSVVARASLRAYESAGVGPQDLDVVELHDAAAPAELLLYEELGLCERNHGPELLRSGATDLGGQLPVNPSGGLLSRGHPIGATGCAQLVELADQLRGRCGGRQVPGARIALAENGGGSIGEEAAAAVVTVLST